jgi:hypothetical protein
MNYFTKTMRGTNGGPFFFSHYLLIKFTFFFYLDAIVSLPKSVDVVS